MHLTESYSTSLNQPTLKFTGLQQGQFCIEISVLNIENQTEFYNSVVTHNNAGKWPIALQEGVLPLITVEVVCMQCCLYDNFPLFSNTL